MSGEEPLPPVPGDFVPPTLVDQYGQRWSADAYRRQTVRVSSAGISGLWFPGANVMVVTPRRLHHNDQLSTLDSKGVLDRPGWGDVFIPWLWLPPSPSDSAKLDFPRSAGGAFQYVANNDIPPDYVRGGGMVDEGGAYAVVWTCKRLGCPPSTEAILSFLPSSTRYEKGTQLAREFGVVRTRRDLGDFYRELEFGGHLPEPAIDRDQQ